MPLWGNLDQANNAPKNVIAPATQGNKVTGTNSYGNTTVAAFVNNQVMGTFAVDTTEFNAANTSSENKRISHTGWNLRKAGTGPVISFTTTATGTSGFANGETFKVSNGTINAIGTITSNATGNLISASVTNGGAGFSNATNVVITFNREKHVTAVTVAGTPTGYSNTDTVIASNGTINATATLVTNSTGGFVTGNVTITNVGLFDSAKVAGNLLFSVVANTGSASAGSGATFTATLGTSTGGAVTVTLGGRAGRVFYETLVATGSIASDAAGDNTILPQT